MFLDSEISQFILLVVLGILARPFQLVFLWRKQATKNILDLILLLLLLLGVFIVSLIVVRYFYSDTLPNLIVRTCARLFISFLLFSPFCYFFEYLRLGIKRGKLDLKRVLFFILLCVFMLLLNRSFV